MYGKMMTDGPQEENVEKKAFEKMLEKIRGMMGSHDAGMESEGDYLDPEKLMMAKGGDMGMNKMDKMGMDKSSMDMEDAAPGEEEGEEDMDMGEDEGDEPFAAEMGKDEDKLDPEEVAAFFGKRPGMDRKPLKGMKIGMTEVSMSPMKKGMNPMMMKKRA